MSDVGVVADKLSVEVGNPRKEQTSFTLAGVGQFLIPLSLVGSISMCPGDSIIPR